MTAKASHNKGTDTKILDTPVLHIHLFYKFDKSPYYLYMATLPKNKGGRPRRRQRITQTTPLSLDVQFVIRNKQTLTACSEQATDI